MHSAVASLDTSGLCRALYLSKNGFHTTNGDGLNGCVLL